MKKGSMTPTFIQSLQDELVLEIFTKVASYFFRSLYFAKMVCNKFNQFAQHDSVFKHIRIQRFERVDLLTSRSKDEEVYKFLERCREIESLKTAISKGHQASTYVYDAILVCQEEKKKRKASGFSILSTIRNW
ncbi:F-box protein [Pyrus ussuriensis x Pyrus communis]|uniref:F-box protein n=1 Tax=Pyrus ussuriensis x Pyrus communis TaxID=2448454 RepID=A0A5N5I7N5_9ROSA|nr:F-box protein [Pyrus ussuriensis x Pyrus communis]